MGCGRPSEALAFGEVKLSSRSDERRTKARCSAEDRKTRSDGRSAVVPGPSEQACKRARIARYAAETIGRHERGRRQQEQAKRAALVGGVAGEAVRSSGKLGAA